MGVDVRQRGVLLNLAAEGVIPVLGGCAGMLVGGGEAGVAGVAVGQVIEKAINFFGARIVQRWGAWFRDQPPEARAAALAELASLSPEEARHEAAAVLDRLAPDAAPADRSLALEYLTAIPRTLDRALLRDSATSALSLPPTVSFEHSQLLLQLLPTDVPPYPVPSPLPGTQYVLEQLLGSGGFGAVYRATASSLQHLPFAIKFCLDPTLKEALDRERHNLERLMKAGGESWSPRIVRLYGCDLDHATPYLVYEYVPGGDLIHHLAGRRQRDGRPLNADEVRAVIEQVTEALAFAHGHGLVHRDLKPANVLVANGPQGALLKLADFGLGGVTAARAVQVSRIGATTIDFLTLAEQASLFRGAGTPLYMSPEQRRGASPDPRHDLYSLGVMWYQLLVGDVTRELHPGWAKELALRFGVPRADLDLIERCIGWLEERPRNAGELLPLVRALSPHPPAAIPLTAAPADPPPAPAPVEAIAVAEGPSSRLRQSLLASLVKQIEQGHTLQLRLAQRQIPAIAGMVLLSLLLSWLIGGAAYTTIGGGDYVIFLCVFVFPAALTLLIWGYRRNQEAVRHRLQEQVRTLAAEFPAVVQQWGGVSVLQAPETFREIARSLEGSPPPRVPSRDPIETALPMTASAVSANRRPELRNRLQQLAAAHADVNRATPTRPFPIWAALILGVLAGVPAGLGVGAYYHDQFAPDQRSNWPSNECYDHNGNQLSPVAFTLAQRTNTATSVLIGIGAGLVLAGFVTWLLAWFSFPRARLLLGLAGGVLLGVPAAFGARAIYLEFFEPYRQSSAWGQPEGFYDHNGNTITPSDYFLARRMEQANAGLVGVFVGVALLLLIIAGSLVLFARRQSRGRRELSAQVQQLHDTFPEAVQAWGGPAVLYKESAVQEMLRGLEAAPQ